MLRNLKQMHIPLIVSVGAFFINIFFNWLFIFGRLGAPAMGVAGAALGALISRCFEFAAICGYFFLAEKRARFRVRDILAPCGDLAPEYLRISLPVMVSDTLLGLGNSVTMAVAGHIGDTRFLMIADVVFLWVVSVPLGYLAGLVWRWPPFWVFLGLRLDHVIKAVWCVFRLRGGKWIKKIKAAGAGDRQESRAGDSGQIGK